MNQIEKILLDIVIVNPIDNCLSFKRDSDECTIKESLIFFRKFLKSNNQKLDSINQLYDCIYKSFFSKENGHYYNIHYLIYKFLDDLSSRYNNYQGFFSDHNYYQDALKYVDKDVCKDISYWLEAIRNTYNVCGTAPSTIISRIKTQMSNYVCIYAIERYVRFLFCFFEKDSLKSCSYDLYNCIKKYMDQNQLDQLKSKLPNWQFDFIIECYNEITRKRSNKIKLIRVKYEKNYSHCLHEQKRREIVYSFYKDNENEPFAGRLCNCYMDENDIKMMLSSANDIVLDDDCQIVIEEKRTLITFIKIVIDKNKCLIFDNIYNELLYSEDLLIDGQTQEDIYCKAIKKLINDCIVDKNYQMVLENTNLNTR